MTADAAAAGEQLEALRARLDAVDDPAIAELVETMRTTLEELRAAESELLRQNDELASLQHAIVEEADRYRGLFELAPIAVLTTDRHATIVDANETAASLLAVPRRFLIGKPLPLYLEEPGRRELRSRALRLADAADDAAESCQVRMRRRTGVRFDAVVTAKALGTGVQWVVQDVTEERQAERRLWELNRDLETRVVDQAGELVTVLEQLPVGVVIVEPDTLLVRSANKRAQEILGEAVSTGRAVGVDGFERYDTEGRPLGPESWPVTRALAGESVGQEVVEVVTPDGRRLVLAISAVPARAADGHVTGAVLTIDDVTLREVRERAEREFVTNAAHELRTPLTAIATAVEVLQSGAKEVPEERDLFLGHLERECGRLSRLGAALLSLARAQAQQEEPRAEIVRLHDVLTAVAADLAVAEGVELRVECAPDVAALANRDLVEQAVWNIATNAARYTAHGEIVLAARLEDTVAAVEVRDTGPGIAADARPRLFDRFYRVDRQDRTGFGLGLSIAKQSAESAGGSLTVESADGVGTLARITLPLARLL